MAYGKEQILLHGRYTQKEFRNCTRFSHTERGGHSKNIGPRPFYEGHGDRGRAFPQVGVAPIFIPVQSSSVEAAVATTRVGD
jgi:hypothetical protein